MIRTRSCLHGVREARSLLRGTRRNGRPADKTPAVSAARIHTALTRGSFAVLAATFVLAGAASGASARSARVDSTAPTTPTNVRVSSVTSSTVALAWAASSDNRGVRGYTVSLDGKVVGRPTQPRATITGLACGRAYTFGIVAYDAADNRSPAAWATVATAACPDQQSPTAPTGFRQQAATQNAVVLAWDSSTDNIGVVGYGVYRNGLLQTSTAAPTVSLSGFVCGSVSEVAIDAVDAAGNRSLRSSTWVETAACSDTQRPAKPVLTLGTATETSLVLNWQPGVDNVGADHYNVFLNGAKVAQTTALTWTYTGLACNTDYTLGLEVEDAAGNTSLLTEGTLTPVRTNACSPAPPPVDTTAPSQPGGLTVAAATTTGVTLAWTASTDNVGVAGYGVYVDGASVQTETQPGATVSGLACGTAYTLAVDAFDPARNRSTKASLVGTTAPCADTQAPSAPANAASDLAHGDQHRPLLVRGVRQRRGRRVRPVPGRNPHRDDGRDDGHLLEPGLRGHVHAGSGLLRRRRKPFGQVDDHGFDNRLSGHDSAFGADRPVGLERHRHEPDPRLERLDGQRRRDRVRRLQQRREDRLGHRNLLEPDRP